MIKNFIIDKLPFLGKYKRLGLAYRDTLSNKDSYSQYQEDIFVLDFLKNSKINRSNSIFVEIGANHPTVLSNTFLLYKNGYRGVLVEPNPELARLLEKFRKKDLVFNIGASNISGILKFNVSKTPVVSSFHSSHNQNNWKSIYVPVLPANLFLKSLKYDVISFLSIDVEGLNLEVLEGALEILEKVFLLCIEFENDEEKNRIISILTPYSFELVKEVGCNLIFFNSKYSYLLNQKQH